MDPYLGLIMAEMQEADPTPHLEALAALPLEKRYVWRVASAQVGICRLRDRERQGRQAALSPEDFAKVMELLRQRPIQWCLFSRALVGAEQMGRTKLQAIGVAKQQGDPT
jgi:hypothetical protein